MVAGSGNQDEPGDDLSTMRCDDVQDALSARLDGEALPAGLDDASVDGHVATCVACAAFAAGAAAQHRSLRVRPAEEVPDLTASILAATAHLRPQPVREWARYGLLAVALTQLVLALPALLLGDDAGASVHVARELGSFDAAVAVGLLWAAWQPRRAAGLLPVAGALAAAMLLTGVLDVAGEDAPVLGEARHLLELAGLALLWALANPPRRTGAVHPGTALAA
jgi:predicted anti-sigma-YlaC factor YlaD